MSINSDYVASRLRLDRVGTIYRRVNAPSRTSRVGKLLKLPFLHRNSVYYQPGQAKWWYASIVYICMSMVTAISPHTLNKAHHTPSSAKIYRNMAEACEKKWAAEACENS
jgi:hypothetical protein